MAVEEEHGLDQYVAFAFRGAPSDIDRVLAAAQLRATFTDGITVFQTPIDGFELVTLHRPRTGSDQWAGSGETIHRYIVRGGLPEPDTELVHVWAFTT